MSVWVPKDELARPRMADILVQVAERFGLTPETLRSDRRDARIIAPRHAAIWLCRRANYTLPEIGRVFRRDHTTVLYSVRRVTRLIEERPEEWGALMVMLAAEAGGMGSPLVAD